MLNKTNMKLLTVLLVVFSYEFQVDGLDQGTLDYIGTDLQIQYKVVSNLNGNSENFDAQIVLTNSGDQNINENSWELYFFSFYMIEPNHLPNPDGFEIPGTHLRVFHMNGGLFKFVPNKDFPGLSALGGNLTINLVIGFWSVSKTDIITSWYVAGPNLTPVDILSTKDDNTEFVADFVAPEQYKRYKEDEYHPYTTQERYDRLNYTDNNVETQWILPTPVKLLVDSTQHVMITNAWQIECLAFENECMFLADYFGIEVATNLASKDNVITIDYGQVAVKESLYINESYSLIVKSKNIWITSPYASGAFYGIQSLISLAEGIDGKIPHVDITDAPRYEYRGLQLDVARNFVQKSDVIQLLKIMAKYKLNNFHIHLTDDEGWRIPIDWCPELTDLGGRRSHDLNEDASLIPQLGSGATFLNSGSGYYTKRDYKEILQEAERLHIRVIPELDLPGHAHAAIKANLAYYKRLEREGNTDAQSQLIIDLDDGSQYLSVQLFNDNAVNPCVEGTYSFIRKVVENLVELHRGIQNLTVFHLGGDEVSAGAWTNSSKCEELFASTSNEGYPSRRNLSEYFVINASLSALAGSESPLSLGFWEDGAMDENNIPYEKELLSPNDVVAYAWQNVWEWGLANRAYKLANAGYKVVMSQATHLYFDQAQEPDPEERGLYWAARFTDIRKTYSFMPDDLYANSDVKLTGELYSETDLCRDFNCTKLMKPENIIGMQGQLFNELIKTKSDMHYMIFPRMLALAERAWHKAEWEAVADSAELDVASRDDDWSKFAATLGKKELSRLSKDGIYYRVPLPGVQLKDNKVAVRCEFPGMSVRYRANQKQWHTFACGATLMMVEPGAALEFQAISAASKTPSETRYSRSVYLSIPGNGIKKGNGSGFVLPSQWLLTLCLMILHFICF